MLIREAFNKGYDLVRVVRGLGGFYYKFYLAHSNSVIVIALDSNGIDNLWSQKVRKFLNYVMDRDGNLPIRFNLDGSIRLSIANNFGYVDIYFSRPLAVSTTYGIFTVDELAYLNNDNLVIEIHDKQRNIKQSLHVTQLLPKLECLGTNYQDVCVDPKLAILRKRSNYGVM